MTTTPHEFNESDGTFYDIEYFISMEYRYLSGAHGSRMRNILASIGDVRGVAVLDVGCGGGFFTNVLHEQGANVVGVDYAPHGIAFGHNRYPDVDLRVHSALELETLGENQFEVVTLLDVIEHISDHDRLMRGIRHVLKPNGRLIISTDADDSLWHTSASYHRWMARLEHLSGEGRAFRLIKRVEHHRREVKNYHASHIATMTTADLFALLEKHGFTVRDQRIYPIVGVPVRDAVLRLLPRLYRGDHQCVVATV
jgi:2-polyprenyl-3-methyl-5-hydroxy-6-metoxy-1,4-benzoquinol methylase